MGSILDQMQDDFVDDIIHTKGQLLEFDLSANLSFTYSDDENESDLVVFAPTGSSTLWRVIKRDHRYDSVYEAPFPSEWVPGAFASYQELVKGWNYAREVINQELG